MTNTTNDKTTPAPLPATELLAGSVATLEPPDSAGRHVSSKTRGPLPSMQGDDSATNAILPRPHASTTVGTGACNKRTVALNSLIPPSEQPSTRIRNSNPW